MLLLQRPSPLAAAAPAAAAPPRHHRRRAARGAVLIRRATLPPEPSGHTPWYEKQKDLWTELHTDADFDAAAAALPPGKLLLVEYYARWCAVCKAGFPQLCKLAADADHASAYTFSKATIEDPEVKARLKSEGITGIPWICLYAPPGSSDGGKARRLASFGASFKRLDAVRANLGAVQRMYAARGADQPFVLDPNGFIVTGEEEEGSGAGAGGGK